jgi:hypothetical protein
MMEEGVGRRQREGKKKVRVPPSIGRRCLYLLS